MGPAAWPRGCHLIHVAAHGRAPARYGYLRRGVASLAGRDDAADSRSSSFEILEYGSESPGMLHDGAVDHRSSSSTVSGQTRSSKT